MSMDIIGGPGSFGLKFDTEKEVLEWVRTTPTGEDPRDYMTDEEVERFNSLVPHTIASLEVEEQQPYFDVIRHGHSSSVVAEIAGYEHL